MHRIDKDTSGLLIVAKTDRAHVGLAAQIETHSFVRRYDAVLIGCPREDEGRIDAPIGRHPTDRKKMAVTDRNSKRAVTDYRITEHFSGYSLASVRSIPGVRTRYACICRISAPGARRPGIQAGPGACGKVCSQGSVP